MSLLKKATASREKGYILWCGQSPRHNIYRSPSRFWAFFSAFSYRNPNPNNRLKVSADGTEKHFTCRGELKIRKGNKGTTRINRVYRKY